ncbi:uncharacterized protein ACIQIH_007642 isoform 1-T2 [Cyanocitta cristata]
MASQESRINLKCLWYVAVVISLPENRLSRWLALDQGSTEKNVERAVCTPSTGHWNYPERALREERAMSEQPAPERQAQNRHYSCWQGALIAKGSCPGGLCSVIWKMK